MQPPKKRKLDNTLVTSPHPLEIRPEGNVLLLTNEERKRAFEARKNGLGSLSILPDTLLYSIVGEIGDSESVRNFGFASKFCYAFAWQDELWKELFVEDERQIKQWKGTWRRSYWGLSRDQEARVTCSIIEPGLSTSSGDSIKTYLYSDLLYRPFQCSQVDFESYIKRGLSQLKSHVNLDIERISQPLSESEFQAKSDQPFILTQEYPRGDGSEVVSWSESHDMFSVEKLVENFGHVIFRQECVDWPLATYEGYMKDNVDESPLYLFDCRSQVMKGMLEGNDKSEENDKNDGNDKNDKSETGKPFRASYIDPYIPEIFKTDLFTLCGEARPDFSWMIIGPRNSGSTFHKDPNSTCAWNSILKGAKYWVMFPPHVTPPGIYTDGEESEVTSPCSLAEWFLGGFYNDVVMEGLSTDSSSKAPFLHGMCQQGETMYVPAGWWHMVVNVCESECVAVTQNFIPRGQKLVEALKFLRDKPDQISGFQCEKVAEWAQKLQVPDAPIYDLFVKVLEQSEYKKDLEDALEKLPQKNIVKKNVWQELTEDKDFGFSFGF
ncbi:F-box protein [Yarrowia sp. C11]|nr:F-box protein [Yarrowia sp. C11]